MGHGQSKCCMAGSAYSAPAEIIRSAMDTHSPSRLLRTLEQSETRLVSARGIAFAADGMIHAEATKLLHTKTPPHVMDAGLRDALGRSACTLQNLVSVETPTACDRLYLILTGTPTRSPLKCLLCDTDAVDDNTHVKTCPATHMIKRPAQGRTGTPQTRKMLAPVGPAFGPIDTHEGHQARSEKRGSRSFQIIFYLGAETRT